MPRTGVAGRAPTGTGLVRLVGILSVTQIISWGSVYYTFPILIGPTEAEMGWSRGVVAGSFTASLVTAGVLAVPVGHLIRRMSGRLVMAAGSVGAALGLASLSRATSITHFYLAWIALGAAMALVLYTPAFATIVETVGADYRRAIAIVTVAGGFASTIFWPLTQWLVIGHGWRAAVLTLAIINLVVAVPLTMLMPRRPSPSDVDPRGAPIAAPKLTTYPGVWRLMVAFSLNALVLSGVSVHLLAMIQERSVDPQQAAWLGALLGPAKVTARLVELSGGRHYAPAGAGVAGLAGLVAELAARQDKADLVIQHLDRAVALLLQGEAGAERLDARESVAAPVT